MEFSIIRKSENDTLIETYREFRKVFKTNLGD